MISTMMQSAPIQPRGLELTNACCSRAQAEDCGLRSLFTRSEICILDDATRLAKSSLMRVVVERFNYDDIADDGSRSAMPSPSRSLFTRRGSAASTRQDHHHHHHHHHKNNNGADEMHRDKPPTQVMCSKTTAVMQPYRRDECTDETIRRWIHQTVDHRAMTPCRTSDIVGGGSALTASSLTAS
jgi:hypothetical protein